MKVFISHSSDETELATSFANWLEKDLSGVKTFCTSRPGDIGAEEWRKRIFNEATQNDILICLLSYESVHNMWIHFEAGLATASQKARIVPAIYGGLKKKKVPSTLNQWQIIDLTDTDEFNRALSTVFRDHISEQNVLSLESFLKSSDKKVGRFVQYGQFGTLVSGNIECFPIDRPIELVPECATKEFPLYKNGGRVTSVRLVIRPLPVERFTQWKCGLDIAKRETLPGERYFAFHSGCHFNTTSFTVYPGHEKRAFISVPATLRFNQEHSIQLWFGSNFKEIHTVGIDSVDKYYRLSNDGTDSAWRPNINGCDIIRLHAWADGDPFRICLENVEIDYVKLPNQAIHPTGIAG